MIKIHLSFHFHRVYLNTAKWKTDAGEVATVIASQAEGPTVNYQHLCKLDTVAPFCNFRTEEIQTGVFLGRAG